MVSLGRFRRSVLGGMAGCRLRPKLYFWEWRGLAFLVCYVKMLDQFLSAPTLVLSCSQILFKPSDKSVRAPLWLKCIPLVSSHQHPFDCMDLAPQGISAVRQLFLVFLLVFLTKHPVQ